MAHNEPAIVRDVAKRSTVNEPPLNNTFDSRSSRDLQVLINRSCLTEISRDVDANERINERALPIYLSSDILQFWMGRRTRKNGVFYNNNILIDIRS